MFSWLNTIDCSQQTSDFYVKHKSVWYLFELHDTSSVLVYSDCLGSKVTDRHGPRTAEWKEMSQPMTRPITANKKRNNTSANVLLTTLTLFFPQSVTPWTAGGVKMRPIKTGLLQRRWVEVTVRLEETNTHSARHDWVWFPELSQRTSALSGFIYSLVQCYSRKTLIETVCYSYSMWLFWQRWSPFFCSSGFVF